MTTEQNIYTWIADYACKHRLGDIINEMFEGAGKGQFSTTDMSLVNLKITLIWFSITCDVRESYMDAVKALDSFLDEAAGCGSLEILLRLSLGLKLKDLVHSLNMPAALFDQKLQCHFPSAKFHPRKERFLLVLSENELEELEDTMPDVCNYFHMLVRNDEEKTKLTMNYAESMFGSRLTENLKSLAEIFFRQLLLKQPLNKLEQMVSSDLRPCTHTSHWDNWLSERLSGIKTLRHDDVRDLLVQLHLHRLSSSAKDQHKNKDSLEGPSNQFEEQTPRSVPIVLTDLDHTSICHEKASSSIIPSSCGDEDIWIHADGPSSEEKRKTDVGEYSIPNLRQFLKQAGIRGCIVKLNRV